MSDATHVNDKIETVSTSSFDKCAQSCGVCRAVDDFEQLLVLEAVNNAEESLPRARRQGDDARAAWEYEAALKLDPSQQQARIYLADLRMRTDNPDQAASLYRGAVDASPSDRPRMSLALAYVKARHYADARQVLEIGIATASENTSFLNALARILAAAPDASLRDGPRALQMARALFEATRSPDVGQTYAMALAETGDFERAFRAKEPTPDPSREGNGPEDVRRQFPSWEGSGVGFSVRDDAFSFIILHRLATVLPA